MLIRFGGLARISHGVVALSAMGRIFVSGVGGGRGRFKRRAVEGRDSGRKRAVFDGDDAPAAVTAVGGRDCLGSAATVTPC